MCGIAGMLAKVDDGSTRPIGTLLMMMAPCLQHRGRDSAGIAVFDGNATGEALRLHVMLPRDAQLPEPKAILAITGRRISKLEPEPRGFNATAATADVDGCMDLVRTIESRIPGATVSAYGRFMKVAKAVGTADGLLCDAGDMSGTHGILHLRLATESRIDPAHAQPFWGRPYPDIAVTHNGHITNYHNLRRQFEARSVTFASRNDSEIIGTFLGHTMSQGASFVEALREAVGELDGSFSFIAATEHGIGVARDPFATKPLLYSETDDYVLLGSEPQALHRVLGNDAKIGEIVPKEVRVWAKA
jgi:methylamine---glutamate N-methyltransferase subunit A